MLHFDCCNSFILISVACFVWITVVIALLLFQKLSFLKPVQFLPELSQLLLLGNRIWKQAGPVICPIELAIDAAQRDFLPANGRSGSKS
jgi:hypothetical protein